MLKPRKKFMQEAIRAAKAAKNAGDYAVGAVLVKNGQIIAKCGNRSKRDESPVAHAEILTLIQGSKILNNRHLTDCVLYSTHEPCPMCSTAAVFARLKGVVFGARIEDMKAYAQKNKNKVFLWRTIEVSCENIVRKSTENVEVVKDFLREECVKLFHST